MWRISFFFCKIQLPLIIDKLFNYCHTNKLWYLKMVKHNFGELNLGRLWKQCVWYLCKKGRTNHARWNTCYQPIGSQKFLKYKNSLSIRDEERQIKRQKRRLNHQNFVIIPSFSRKWQLHRQNLNLGVNVVVLLGYEKKNTFLDVLKLCYIRAERLFFLIQSLETRGRNVCDSNEWEKKHIETTWPLPRHGRLALVFSCILYILNILYASLCPRRTLFRLKHKNNKKSTSNSFLFVVRIFFYRICK